MAYDKDAEGAAFKGVTARAYSGTVCKPYSAQKAHLIIEWQESRAEFGSILTSQIGLALGISHDFAAKNGGKCANVNDVSIMGYNDQREIWSSCSRDDFRKYYNSLQDSWCME